LVGGHYDLSLGKMVTPTGPVEVDWFRIAMRQRKRNGKFVHD
jgi:hypothetical protein